jgi:hypothetical protein
LLFWLLPNNFELLVGISGAYFADKKSVHKHFYTQGGYVPVPFELDDSVGVDKDHPVNIQFIPDDPSSDKIEYPAYTEMLLCIENNVNLKLINIERTKKLIYELIVVLP